MWPLRIAGYSIGLAFVAVSAIANARSGMAQGHDDIDKALYLAGSLGTDGLKVLLPVLAVELWSRRARAWSVLTTVVWVSCMAWAFAGAVGWASKSAGSVTGEASAYAKAYKGTEAVARRLSVELESYPAHRSPEVVTALIDGNDVPAHLWRRSDKCTNATEQTSRAACAPVMALRAELEVSKAARASSLALDTVRDTLSRLKAPATHADPQAAGIVAFMAPFVLVEAVTVRGFLNTGFSLLVETASAIMFVVTHLATASRISTKAPPQPAEKTPPPAPSTKPINSTPPPPAIKPVVARNCEPSTRSVEEPSTVVQFPHPRRSSSWAPNVGPVEAWAALRVEVSSTGSIRASTAFEDFRTHCPAAGLSAQTFGIEAKRIIENLGGTRAKRRDANYFEGVGLITTTPQQERATTHDSSQ